MGENLKEQRDFCDLSLYFDNKELIEAIKETPRNSEKMQILAKKTLTISVKVSDELNKVIKEQRIRFK